jgi:hypothetical protein
MFYRSDPHSSAKQIKVHAVLPIDIRLGKIVNENVNVAIQILKIFMNDITVLVFQVCACHLMLSFTIFSTIMLYLKVAGITAKKPPHYSTTISATTHAVAEKITIPPPRQPLKVSVKTQKTFKNPDSPACPECGEQLGNPVATRIVDNVSWTEFHCKTCDKTVKSPLVL